MKKKVTFQKHTFWCSKCVGCGLCIPYCGTEAISLVRRPEEEVLTIPVTEHDWMKERAIARNQDINEVM